MDMKQVIEERIKVLADHVGHPTASSMQVEDALFKWVELACALEAENNEPDWIEKYCVDHGSMPDDEAWKEAARLYPIHSEPDESTKPFSAWDALRAASPCPTTGCVLLDGHKGPCRDVVREVISRPEAIHRIGILVDDAKRSPSQFNRAMETIAHIATRVQEYEAPPKTTGLDFGQALAAMREGKRVRRSGWPDHIKRERRNGITLERGLILTKDEHSETSILLCGSDLLATDWEVIQ
jgi:hypothetical protein